MIKTVLTNLEPLTFEYVRTDSNAIIKIFSPEKWEKPENYLKHGSSSKTQMIWTMDLWLSTREDYIFYAMNVCI